MNSSSGAITKGPYWRTTTGPQLRKWRRKMGVHLKDLRTDRGFSLSRFADQIGVSRWTVANWESAATSVPTDILPVIAKVLKVTVVELTRVLGPSVPSSGEAAA